MLGRGDLPLQDIEAWASTTEMQRPLVSGDPQNTFIDSLRQGTLPNTQPVHIRIIGEAGAGKTRLTLQALKADGLRSLVVYCESPKHLLESGLITHMTRSDSRWNAILVVDECDFTKQTEIWNRLQPHSPRVKLVTIYNEPDESNGKTTYLDTPRLSDDQIQDIIASYDFPKDDTFRWAQYCGGSPRVAHVIGGNLKNNADILASPDTINIWERYVAGTDDPNSDAVKKRLAVLRWLSLFKRFGYEAPLQAEGKLIAAKIEKEEGIGYREFQRIVSDLRKRKILQGETTLYITPELLHIKLWAEWWDTYGSDAVDFDLDWVRTIDGTTDPPIQLSDQLMDWFGEQFRYANESSVAPRVVNRLLGPNGPFRNLDFLDSERGSKFFLYLTEAAPGEALDCLRATIGKLSKNELTHFKDGRRNVIWALQRILVWRDYFTDAAELLLKLAEAENEGWGNNATGIFNGLFTPAYGKVAASEASPKDRFPVLKAAIESDSATVRGIALSAAIHALDTNFVNMNYESVYQGLRKDVDLWMPKTYGELWEAYEMVWDMLVGIATDGPADIKDEATKNLIDRSRIILQIQSLIPKVLDTLESISKEPRLKQEVLSEVITILHYDKKRLPKKIVARLQKLQSDLIGTDYHSLMERYVGLDLLEDHFSDSGEQGDQIGEKIQVLAKQSLDTPKFLKEKLDWLMSGKPQNGLRFGYDLGVLDVKHALLADLLEAQRKVDENTGAFFLGGYFRAVREQDVDFWENELDKLIKDEKLRIFVPEFSWRSGMTDRAAARILNLAKAGIIGLNHFRAFGFGSAIDPLSEKALLEWIDYVVEQPDAYAPGIAIDFMHFHYVMKKKDTLPKELTKRILLDDRLFTKQEGQRPQMEDYYWTKLAEAYVALYPSEAPDIAEKMLAHFEEDGTIVGAFHGEIQNVLNQIARINPAEVWRSIIKYIGPPYSSVGFRITTWLRGQLDFDTHRVVGALCLLPADLLWSWIDEKDTKARASYAASFVPAFLSHDDERVCLARELLVRYGDDAEVRGALRANFTSEGWSGKASQHYLAKQQGLLEYKETETDANVNRWIDEYVKTIDDQIKRARIDEERNDFGF